MKGRQGKDPDLTPHPWGIKPAAAPFIRRALSKWNGTGAGPAPDRPESILLECFQIALEPGREKAHFGLMFERAPRFSAFALSQATEYTAKLSKRELCRIVALAAVPPFWLYSLCDDESKRTSTNAKILEIAKEIRPDVTQKDAENAVESILREIPK